MQVRVGHQHRKTAFRAPEGCASRRNPCSSFPTRAAVRRAHGCLRFAVGAVLQQDQGKGLQPIAYLSKKMLDAETRYPVHEQELLAIIVALKCVAALLDGRQVHDHRQDRSQVAAALQDAAAALRSPGALEGRHRELRLRHRVHRRQDQRRGRWTLPPTGSPSTAASSCSAVCDSFTRQRDCSHRVTASVAAIDTRCWPTSMRRMQDDPAYRSRTEEAPHSQRIRLHVKGGLALLSTTTACTSRTISPCRLASCRSATMRPPVATSARTRPSSR